MSQIVILPSHPIVKQIADMSRLILSETARDAEVHKQLLAIRAGVTSLYFGYLITPDNVSSYNTGEMRRHLAAVILDRELRRFNELLEHSKIYNELLVGDVDITNTDDHENE